ncbi:hypothetical protein V493_02194 [Pseudogymnoascus sp. VKM F-4281 (FW-2241)]|nr:hypothetical protein V493_02194 [Pseudogymnoascus sp. VKM F-4281 (FW-2241)]
MGQDMRVWGVDLAALGLGLRGTWLQVERAVKHGIEEIKHNGMRCASFMHGSGHGSLARTQTRRATALR